MEIAIQASGLIRKFGSLTAVDKLDLQITKGSIYGFLGPNGSGKTTCIRLLTGLLSANAGTIEVLGLSLPGETEKLRRLIGYMTQKFSLYDDLTIEENLRFIAKIYGINGHRQKSRIENLLSVYSLEEKRRQLARSLSGGQKQRLALAAATIHEPQLLFLDEPTSAVDPENRRDFWEKLFDLSDSGTTVLVSTHYMDEAERCHRLAILANGVKRADGTPQELMESMDATVVEISGDGLRQLKQALIQNPDIISAAQQGVRLRTLIRKSISDPVTWLQQQAELKLQNRDLRVVRPSLEDVFVTSTGNFLL